MYSCLRWQPPSISKELAAIAAAVRSKVAAVTRSFNPFQVLDVDITSTTREDLRFGRVLPTEAQLASLERMGVPPNARKAMSNREASKLLADRSRRMDAGLATYKQLALISKHVGLDNKDLTFVQAGKVLTYISQECGWGNRKKPELARALELIR